MSSVDPKPTYSRATDSFLASLSAHLRSSSTRERLHGTFGLAVNTLDWLDTTDALRSGMLFESDYDTEEPDPRLDPATFAELVVSHGEIGRGRMPEDSCEALANAMCDFVSGCKDVWTDSAAMYTLLDDVVLAAGAPADQWPSDLERGLHLAHELTVAGAASMKVHAAAVHSAAVHMQLSCTKQARICAIGRQVAEDLSYHTVSRRVRTNYAAAFARPGSRLSKRIYPDGVTKEALTQHLSGQVRRDATTAAEIDYFFAGRIRIIKRDGVAYCMDTENIRKVYQVAHRRFMAVLGSSAESTISPERSCVPVDVTMRITRELVRGAADNARHGLRIASASRALHQVWCAEFVRAYEDSQPEGYAAAWEKKYDEIMKSAREAHPSADLFAKIVEPLPQSVRLDALRLHHVMAAPDTPPQLLAKLTFETNTKATKPRAGVMDRFMSFVKSYELCMYLYKKRSWPNTGGNPEERKKEWYVKCARGKFTLPPAADMGKLWIEDHFPYVHYADQLSLRAKDATRLPDDRAAAVCPYPTYESWEHNELLHAIKKGNNLGAPHRWSVEEARDEFWKSGKKSHTILDTAAKAEATKSDIKPRGTFSAPGEFRHFQAEFDRNCQVFNDFLGCGSIRADPVNHAKGMSRVATGTRLQAITSSHDLEAWSQSQDRASFCEFGVYRAKAFKGLNATAWADRWHCFDAIINKNGFVRWDHIYNGGFQGFPGTLDTSLHVLILCWFLWRMREDKKIPKGTVALAKATIDDCLAQFADWNGTLIELETLLVDHYRSLGYTIDNVKSVISRCKAIYLNAAYCRGASVAQGVKVFCKTDRPMETVMKTAFDDIGAVTGGTKAAIDQGMLPIAAYFAGAVLAISYVVRAAPEVLKFGVDEFTMFALLPRGDGGLGYPSLSDLVTKEHPDARSQANYVIEQWARAREAIGNAISDKAVRMWHCHKHIPFKVVSKASIFFNPRAVKREGIPDIESLKRQVVINAARKWGAGDPYKSTLEAANNETLMTLYAALLAHASRGVDCSFLEAYSAHLPENILDALVGKVTSYRVAKELLGSREVVWIQRILSERFEELVHVALENSKIESSPREMIVARSAMLDCTGFERAQMEREEFLALNEVVLLNHTIPSPFECISVTSTSGAQDTQPHIGSDQSSLLHWAVDAPRSSKALVSKHGLSYPFKSSGWIADSADEYRYLDQPTHTFVEGCAVIEWARAKGLSVRAWEYVYLHRWLGSHEVSTAEFVTQSMQGSIKRSSAAAGDRYHPIFGMKNLVRSADVNVTSLLALVGERSNSIDPLGLICAAYSIATLNMQFIIDLFAQVKLPNQDFRWGIGLNPGCLEDSQPLEVVSNVSMPYLEAIFDMELDELCFVAVGAGTEKMLKSVSARGALASLLKSFCTVEAVDDAGILGEMGDQITVAPMFALPEAPPPAAFFLSSQQSKKPVNVLVNDSFVSTDRIRLLEISPSAPRLCAVAGLQEAASKFTSRRLAEMILDAELPAKKEEIEIAAKSAAATAYVTLSSNVPTEMPFIATAKGLRAAGCPSFRFDDPRNTDQGVFISNFVSYALLHTSEFLAAVRRTSGELNALTNADYTRLSPAVKVHRDPDAANRRARSANLERKFRARADTYGVRIKTLKARRSVLEQDKLDGRYEVAKKVAYLAGCKALMGSIKLDVGPVPNWEETAERVGDRINRVLIKEGANRFMDSQLLLSTKRFNEPEVVWDKRTLLLAQGGVSKWYWMPEEFVSGVMRATGWVLSDIETELKEVYYVPRTIKITTRVRRTFVEAAANPEPRMPPAPLLPRTVPAAGVPAVPHAAPAPAPPRDEPYDPLKAMREAALARQRERTIEKYEEWTSTLALWKVVVLAADRELDLPGTNREKQAVIIKRHRVTNADLSADTQVALRKELARVLHQNREAMREPDMIDEDNDESLAV